MGLFSKPKTPAPSVEEEAAKRRLRKQEDELTEGENRRLKLARRGAGGRTALLSGNFTSGSTGASGGGSTGRSSGGGGGSGGRTGILSGSRGGGRVLR